METVFAGDVTLFGKNKNVYTRVEYPARWTT